MSAAGDAQGDDGVVSVIVVTHNNRELIGDCLDAIERSATRRELDVIVVDNASEDGTVAAIEQRARGERVLALEDNVGFAAAVNRGRESARGRWLALVNSDALVDPGCIDALVGRLARDPAIAIAGARLRYPDGRLQPSAGTFPSLGGGLWVALFLHRVPGLARLGIGFFCSPALYRRARSVDWVSGAVCAARRDAGPLPASSFMYGEDVEWAAVCRAAGREVWLEPNATAVHIGRASVDASRQESFAQRQRAQFELQWFAPRGAAITLLARGVLLVHGLARVGLFGARALVRRRPDRRVGEFAALARAALSPRSPAR